jgi:hypothetical protein
MSSVPAFGSSVAAARQGPAPLQCTEDYRFAARDWMKIRSHSESHIVELDDGSRWRIFPGDLGPTLDWKPETDLALITTGDEMSSHALIGNGRKIR